MILGLVGSTDVCLGVEGTLEIDADQNKTSFRPGKKNFGSGQLIFENWSGGPVDLFSFFLNHNINIPNLIVQKVLKHEI